MKYTHGHFHRVFKEVASECPGIEAVEMLNHIGQQNIAEKVKDALSVTIENGIHP